MTQQTEQRRRPCKHCGKPVQSKHARVCNRCKNYPPVDLDTADLWNKFNFGRLTNARPVDLDTADLWSKFNFGRLTNGR